MQVEQKQLLDRRLKALQATANEIQNQIMVDDEADRTELLNFAGGAGEDPPAKLPKQPKKSFGEVFQGKLAKEKKGESFEKDTWYTKALSKLGEKSSSSKKGKKRKKDDDSDSDLEVVEDDQNKAASMTCPITTAVYVDPMKCKVSEELARRKRRALRNSHREH